MLWDNQSSPGNKAEAGETDVPWYLRFGPFLLLCLGIAAYANSFCGVFIFDDFHSIVSNERIRTLSGAVLHSTRPVVNLSFHLNYLLGGLTPKPDPFGFHLVNMLVHLSAGLALLGISRRILLKTGRPAAVSAGLAAVIAGIWTVHPLQTESVTYIVQRSECMMGLFCLLSIYFFLLSEEIGNRPTFWLALSVISCALGMATKPVMAVVPVVILLLHRWYITGSITAALRSHTTYYVSMAATIAIPFVLVASPNESSGSLGFAQDMVSPVQYYISQPVAILHYLKLAFWPVGLCLDYGWSFPATVREALWPALAFCTLTAPFVWLGFRNRLSGNLGLIFLALLAPSSLVPIIDPVFEHRMYVPLAVVVALTVVPVWTWLEKAAGRKLATRAGVPAALVCIAALANITVTRNLDYRSEIAMWQSVIKVRPDNLRARNNLAVALGEAGRKQEAEREFDDVLRRTDTPAIKSARLTRTISGTSPEYNRFLALANKGLLTFKSERAAEAADLYAAALKMMASDNVAAKLEKALIASGIDGSEAEKRVRKLLTESCQEIIQASPEAKLDTRNEHSQK